MRVVGGSLPLVLRRPARASSTSWLARSPRMIHACSMVGGAITRS